MQQISQNYFQLFDIPESFSVDVEGLAEKYRQLQREAHPDRFAGDGEQARMRAVQLTSLVNEGYATLKSPLQRAGYLLKLRDLETEQATQEDLGMELLMEQMQLREQLAELPADDSALDELARLRSDTESRIRDREAAFAEAFGQERLLDAKRVFHELQFLHKLRQEIVSGEEKRLGY